MKINNPEDPTCQLLRIRMRTQIKQNGGAAKTCSNLLIQYCCTVSKQLIEGLINDEHGRLLPLIYVGSKLEGTEN